MTELVLRTNGFAPLKAPVPPKQNTSIHRMNLEWCLRALEALVPLTSALTLTLPPGKDSNDDGRKMSLAFVLTLPENMSAEPISGEFSTFALRLPIDLTPGDGGDRPFVITLTTPEAIVEEGPVRLNTGKPMPASFQQAKRQRYIYDW